VSAVVLSGAVLLAAETRKEFHFTVGARPTVSVTNQYGSVSVKPATANQVTVTAILRSDKVEIDKGQSGNRVDLLSHLLMAQMLRTVAWIMSWRFRAMPA